MTDAECTAILQWALPRLGRRWAGFRKVRRLVAKRLGRRLRVLALADLDAYRGWLEAHPQEWAELDAQRASLGRRPFALVDANQESGTWSVGLRLRKAATNLSVTAPIGDNRCAHHIRTADGGLPSKWATRPACPTPPPLPLARYAILIDGGFVARKLGTATAPMSAKVLHEFTERLRADPLLVAERLHRIYYYDATPLTGKQRKPLKGEEVDFSSHPRAVRQRQLYEELSRYPYVAIRSGECTFGGWAVQPNKLKANAESVQIAAGDLRPLINQKGVDMRIGMDIAALTLKKLVEIIVLVTGDSDFVPAMKFARREGAQLFLAPMGHGIREAMFEHSDLVLNVK